jgi:serine/threonine protein kinase
MDSNIIIGTTGIIEYTPYEAKKWFFDTEEYHHEFVSYSNILSKIDPSSIFTPRFICNSNEPYPSDLEPHFRPYFETSNIPTLHTITMEYTGPTLYDIYRTNGKFYPNINIDRFTRALFKLLNGMERLQCNEMAHCDIKPSNLTYNIDTNTLKLIDFGWLYPYNHIYQPIQNSISYLGVNYMYFPPEFKITYVLLRCKKYNLKVPTQYEFRDKYLYPYFKAFGRTELLYNSFYPFAIDDLATIYERAKMRFIQSDRRIIYQGPYDTIDAFGLGLTLMEFIHRLNDKNNCTYTVRIYKLIMHLIMGFCHPNPFSRLTISKAKELLEEYFIRYV